MFNEAHTRKLMLSIIDTKEFQNHIWQDYMKEILETIIERYHSLAMQMLPRKLILQLEKGKVEFTEEQKVFLVSKLYDCFSAIAGAVLLSYQEVSMISSAYVDSLIANTKELEVKKEETKELNTPKTKKKDGA